MDSHKILFLMIHRFTTFKVPANRCIFFNLQIVDDVITFTVHTAQATAWFIAIEHYN